MTYNITGMKTTLLDTLMLKPMNLFMMHGVKISMTDMGIINIYIGSEGGKIVGIYDPDKETIEISKVENYGEASGKYHEVLKEILMNTTGNFTATVIYEGGDSITKLIVSDGDVKENPVDI